MEHKNNLVVTTTENQFGRYSRNEDVIDHMPKYFMDTCFFCTSKKRDWKHFQVAPLAPPHNVLSLRYLSRVSNKGGLVELNNG
jgi:hypothetical protein